MSKRYTNLAIIIPAYNESENLRFLLPKIASVVPGATVIIVDDSDEKEFAKIRKIAGTISGINVRSVSRSVKSGRGSAVIEGMAQGLKIRSVDYFVEMDADLAHNPDEIPLLLSAVKDGDMVIGSRYLSGSTITDWPLRRLIQSKLINFFLNYWLGLAISDYTNGFRAYSRKAAEYIVSHPPREAGFIALSEIAFELKNQGFGLTEVPVSFTDRKYGKSNAGIAELSRSFVGALRIRFATA